MLVAGLNDDEAALRDITDVVKVIGPDELHIVLPTRPPSESWVHPADAAAILKAISILGEVVPVLHPDSGYGDFALGDGGDPLQAAAAILARHPMSDGQLREALALKGVAEPEQAIRCLADSGKIVAIQRFGTVFWRAP
jgi:wyosine [tRNA(Phe)-imidazoG37] synthetase (radical SAM superfamily)